MSGQSLRYGWLRLLVGAILSTPIASAAAWADDGSPAVGAKSVARVEITMHVPAGARIWFDGEATVQTGATRMFVSPPLDPERQYAYQIRVRWNEGGDVVERTRRLTVQAGDEIGLDFSSRGVVEVMGYSAERPDSPAAPVNRDVPLYYRDLSPTRSVPLADVGGARNNWKPDLSDPFYLQH
jgi:uncharacterized protein (TIGR03000 family)